MFTCSDRVFLKDTDAGGRIYFSSVFDYGLRAFERFLAEKESGLRKFFLSGYGFPVVHAEAKYFFSLEVGEEIQISLTVDRIGNRSFTLGAKIYRKKDLVLVSEVVWVQAFVKNGDKESSPLPEEVRRLLSEIE